MSIVPNYFNNFQVRPPVLKNPLNRAPPQQLTKSRPGQVQYTGAGSSVKISQLVGQTLQIQNTATSQSGFFTLPSATTLLKELGTQGSGLSTNTWSIACTSGDCLFLNVVNRSNNTGALVAAQGSTGTAFILPATGDTAYNLGVHKIVTVQFVNVSSTADTVTGSYIVY